MLYYKRFIILQLNSHCKSYGMTYNEHNCTITYFKLLNVGMIIAFFRLHNVVIFI